MARRIGSGSISSLTRTASAALDRKQAYDDATHAYEFQISGKDPQSYASYVDYLTARAKGVSDPMKQLSLQKTADDARHSFRSSELQRENIQINYGNASLYDKRNLLDRQYREAINNGDYTLAQTIESQRGATDIAIQNAEDAAARKSQAAGDRASREATAAFKRGVNHEITNADNDVSAIKAAYKTGGVLNIGGKKVKIDERNFQQLTGQAIQRKEQLLQEAHDHSDDPDYQFSLQNKLSDLRNSDEYIKYASPNGISERNNRQGGGEDPFATKVDPIYGTRSEFKKDILSTVPMLDKDGKQVLDDNGNPLTVNQYKMGFYSNKSKQNETFVRNVKEFDSDRPQGYDRDYATNVQYDERGRPFTYAPGYDPKQPGKEVLRKFFINPNAKEGEPQLSLNPISGAGNLGSDVLDAAGGLKEWIKENPALAGSIPMAKSIAGGISKGFGTLTADNGKAVKDAFGSLVKNSPFALGDSIFNSLRGYGKDVPGAGSATGLFGRFSKGLTNPAGFIANLLGLDATKRQDAKNLAAIEAKRQAAIQAQNVQRAAEARIAAQNFAARQAAQQKASMASKSYNPSIAKAPPASQIYGVTGGSPAQNAAAVTGSYPARTDSAIAAGLGAAAGYNPNWLINPRF